MVDVIGTIRRLVPDGTSHHIDRNRKWEKPPVWPPDLFAIAATLVEMSASYAKTACLVGVGKAHGFFGPGYVSRVQQNVEEWRESFARGRFGPPDRVVELWRQLCVAGADGNSSATLGRWEKAALELMAIADETCRGMGFLPSDRSLAPELFAYIKYETSLPKKQRPYYPARTLCRLILPSVLCVQPKTVTPEVGCTLRSLSKHLALLPPIEQVQTEWTPRTYQTHRSGGPLNLLLVPYPFRIRTHCFGPLSRSDTSGAPLARGDLHDAGESPDFFAIRQLWLPRARRNPDKVTKIFSFLKDLVSAARQHVEDVDAIILPEAALDWNLLKPLARRVGRIPGIELLITGYMRRSRPLPENGVSMAVFHERRIYSMWHQKKHHRWRMDRQQIGRYHLGSALDPSKVWWEGIDVAGRECGFFVIREGASLTTLVCEDLARIDPVQPVLRSIGPNLVVVLLMDGPQKKDRWSARYATVLADDPGSSVLTLTSLGMARRSVMPGESEPSEIALWKDVSGEVRELKLPAGCHGLVLSLSPTKHRRTTMDHRAGHGSTVRFSLCGAFGVRCSREYNWLE